MGDYTILLTSKAAKQLDKLSDSIAVPILEKLKPWQLILVRADVKS